MKEIGLILVLLWIFAVGCFAVDRLGRFLEKNLRDVNSRRTDAPERCDRKKTTTKKDNWLNNSCKL